MSDTIRTCNVKTRKDHKCWGCWRTIPKGDTVFLNVSSDAGVIVSAYWCKTCERIWNEHGNDIDPYGDGVDQGDLLDAFPELYKDAPQ